MREGVPLALGLGEGVALAGAALFLFRRGDVPAPDRLAVVVVPGLGLVRSEIGEAAQTETLAVALFVVGDAVLLARDFYDHRGVVDGALRFPRGFLAGGYGIPC